MTRTAGASGFLGGIFWGGVVVATTLIALSQMAPMPPEDGPAQTAEAKAQTAAPATSPETAPKPPAAGTVAAEPPVPAPQPPRTPGSAAQSADGKLPAPTLAAPNLAAPAKAPPPQPAPLDLAAAPDLPALPPRGPVALPRPTPLRLAPAGASEPVALLSLPDLPAVSRSSAPPEAAPLPPALPKAEATPAATPALQAFARPFTRSPGKPLFSILLRDIGAKGLARSDLVQLPFPVTAVIDPLAPDAKAAAEAWRAAGQEVVLLGAALPAGAKATDVAQSFEMLKSAVPQAVAVLDPGADGFQDDRGLSALVVPEIAAAGQGLLTWDGGLDAAGQIARHDGLPAATVYRRLDGEGESQPVIRRYLDRAAFKAAQEGQVVVLGDTSPATVAVIMAWALEGKGASVELAPISAILLAP